MASLGSTAWFDRGSNALKALKLIEDDGYACPLCMQVIWRADMELLTLEHVPPASVGGRPLVLTCKDCNSTHGTYLDRHAFVQERARKLVSGLMTDEDAPVPTYTRMDSYSIRGHLKNTGTGLTWDGIPKIVGPPLPEDVTHTFTGFNGRWVMGKSDGRLATLSWYRAAYLVAFAVLGYKYIVGNGFKVLRDSFAGHFDTDFPPPNLWQHDASDTRRLFFVSDSQPEMQIVAVGFGPRMVFLPGLNVSREFWGWMTVQRHRESLLDRDPPVTGKSIDWPTSPRHFLDELRT